MTTHKVLASKIKDPSLADLGGRRIAVAKEQMGALLAIKERFAGEKPFGGIAIGIALHITKETAVLVETLRAGGADVAIASCNPLSTQDDVAAYLAANGVHVYGWKGETIEEYNDHIESVAKFLEVAVKNGKRLVTIDDGCDLTVTIHEKYTHLIPHIIVGTEETTTGVVRLYAMDKAKTLRYPVIAVNNNKTKRLFDNYYGTGQSTIEGVLRASSVLLAGKTVVVAGYGPCGHGVANVSRGMGAHVIVTEVDPVRALQAKHDGFTVMPMKKAAPIGDVFITVTGNIGIITTEEMLLMKENAILANSGHFDVEIDVAGLRKLTEKVEQVKPGLEKYHLPNGKAVYLCGEGRLVNLACAEGHPSAIMSLSFCGQALAAEYGLKHRSKLNVETITLPDSVDVEIAKLQLAVTGTKIDRLTPAQKEYMNSWQDHSLGGEL